MNNSYYKKHHIFEKLNRLATSEPDVRSTVSELESFVGFAFPGQIKPLLIEMCEAGLLAYETATNDKVKAFVIAVFSLSERLWDKTITFTNVRGNQEFWQPIRSAVADFEHRARELNHPVSYLDEVFPSKPSALVAASMLSTRVMTGARVAQYLEPSINIFHSGITGHGGATKFNHRSPTSSPEKEFNNA